MQHGIIMARHPGRTHVALLENGQATEIFSEADDRPGALGNIFVGRVVRVLPGLQAAFVDIGLDRSAFVYVADLLPVAITATRQEQLPPIASVVRPGATLIVQVRKEAMAGKGARVTTHITLTGRHLVLMPKALHVAISQRITDGGRRDALEALLTPLIASCGGMVVRTAGQDVADDVLVEEAHRLAKRWRQMEAKAQSSSKPRALHLEPTAALRAVRELYQPQMQGILVNDAALVDLLTDEVAEIAPTKAHTVTLWSHAPPGMAQLVAGDVWRSHKLDRARTKALSTQEPLPGGGFLIIEQTAALTSIDVNSGTFVGKGGLEKTMVALNVEAARAVAHALRLRNIGGIVVIDFVDVSTAGGRQAIMTALTEAMASDRAKHQILPMNRFSLVALTRRRLRPSVLESATEPCGHCGGTARVLTAQEVGEQAVTACYAALAKSPEAQLLLQVHPDVAKYLGDQGAQALTALEQAMDVTVFVVARSSLRRARFEILSLQDPGRIDSIDAGA